MSKNQTGASVTVGPQIPQRLQASSSQRPAGGIGVVNIQADTFMGTGLRKGLPNFMVALDIEQNCQDAFAELRSAGVKVHSSGGIRELTAPVSAGRIATSFHYTGRAIDLYIYGGMFDPGKDPYVIVEDVSPNLWRVYGRTTDSSVPQHTLTAKRFTRLRPPDQAFVTLSDVVVTDHFVDMTAVLAKHNLERIFSQVGFYSNPSRRLYTAAEWWHFQVVTGLQPGVTTFGSLLDRVHSRATQNGTPPEKFRAYKWDGAVFKP